MTLDYDTTNTCVPKLASTVADEIKAQRRKRTILQ
jgi:hypothetical protein